MEVIKEKVKEFIVDNFLFGNDDGLDDDTSFLEEGIVDSTGILELITFLEAEYSIHVDDDELVPENLDSISYVSEYVKKKTKKVALIAS